MEISNYKKHLSKEEELEFNDYIEQKIPSIKSLLTKFAEDAVNLKISVERFEKHNAYQVEMRLSLPTKTLVSEETSHAMTQAIDLSKDKLVQQIKKHMAQLRKDRSHKSIKEPVKLKEEQFIESLG